MASSKGNWVQCFQKKILEIITQKPPHTSQRVALRYIAPSYKNWWGFRDPGGLKDIEHFLVWGKPEKHHQWFWNTEDAGCVKRTKWLFGVCLSALMLHHKHLPRIMGWRWDAADKPLNKLSCTQSLTAPLLILFHFKWNHKITTSSSLPCTLFPKKV